MIGFMQHKLSYNLHTSIPFHKATPYTIWLFRLLIIKQATL